jgi:tRNA dimethylallyltransferase
VILAASTKINTENLITIVVGPTAAGKSAWALEEAIQNQGAIVNADSIQIYKYVDIGAAMPTKDEQNKAPHFLYGFVEPDQTFTAGDYRRKALEAIETQIVKMPLYIVGGSGFYIQALEFGMYEVSPIQPEVVERADAIEAAGLLFESLHKLDEESARRIGPNDNYRLRRALELVLNEGQPMNQIKTHFQENQKNLNDLYKVRKIGISCDREVLRSRVLVRTKKMLKLGLLDEVKALLDKGYAESKVLSSVGYRECAAYLAGRLKLVDLEASIVTSTMQLAKKQMTWFRRDKSITWIDKQN